MPRLAVVHGQEDPIGGLAVYSRAPPSIDTTRTMIVRGLAGLAYWSPRCVCSADLDPLQQVRIVQGLLG